MAEVGQTPMRKKLSVGVQVTRAGEGGEFSGIAGGSNGTAEEELGAGRSGREQGRGRSGRWLLRGRCCSPEKC
jgi:hypothetical protein